MALSSWTKKNIETRCIHKDEEQPNLTSMIRDSRNVPWSEKISMKWKWLRLRDSLWSPHPTWLPHLAAGKTPNATIQIWLFGKLLWRERLWILRNGYGFGISFTSWEAIGRHRQTRMEAIAPPWEDGTMSWFQPLFRGWILSSRMLQETQSLWQKNSWTVQGRSPRESHDSTLLKNLHLEKAWWQSEIQSQRFE